jgi:1-pyrroline-5-carboxylate dehydrogenase
LERSKKIMGEQLAEIKMGSPEDPSNFVNAVIDKNSFEKCKGYIERAKNLKMQSNFRWWL